MSFLSFALTISALSYSSIDCPELSEKQIQQLFVTAQSRALICKMRDGFNCDWESQKKVLEVLEKLEKCKALSSQ